MKQPWYRLTANETAEKLNTSVSGGLTHREARKRLLKSGQNIIFPASRNTFYRCLKSALLDSTSILLLLTAFLAWIFEADENAVILAVIVLLHLVIVLTLSFRSQKILENTEQYTKPLSYVIRQGKLYLIDPKKLVPGDVVCFSQGDVIPADFRLLQADGLLVDESILCGDPALHAKLAELSYEEEKEPGEIGNMLFAGTLIKEGSGLGCVTATGKNCAVAARKDAAPKGRAEEFPHISVLRRYSKIRALFLIGAVFLLMVISLIVTRNGNMLFPSLLTALTYAVSAMSEMLALFCTVIVACGMFGAVKKYKDINSGAIIKYPAVLDTLKNLTCLVVPKDGVLSTRQYSVEYVCTPIRKYRLSDIRYRSALERPISLAVVTTGCYGADMISSGRVRGSLTDEELAILTVARKLSLYHVGLDRTFPMISHYGADGRESRFTTTVVKSETDYTAILRGDPEQILEECSRYRDGEKILRMTEKRRERLLEACAAMRRDAYTVIGLAAKETTLPEPEFARAAQTDMIFEGLIAYRVPVLRGVPQLIEKCRENGIKVILFDDNADNETAFASGIGILQNNGQQIRAEEYAKLSAEEQQSSAGVYRVYHHLSPTQKQNVIENLRVAGEVVGYVGRTFADYDPMRAADAAFCQNVTLSDRLKDGIIPVEESFSPTAVAESVTKNGCEALKEAADVILSEADQAGNGGFRALIDAILYAKRINRNLLHMLRYLLSSSFARLFILLFGILLGMPILTNVQIAFSGLIIDFAAILIIAFEKPGDETLGLASKTKEQLADPAGILKTSALYALIWTAMAVGFAAVLQLLPLGMDQTSISGAVFVLWACMQIALLFVSKRDTKLLEPGLRINGIQSLTALILGEIFILFFLIPPLGKRFSVVSFPFTVLIPLFITLALFILLTETVKRIVILPRLRKTVQSEEPEKTDQPDTDAAVTETDGSAEPEKQTETGQIETESISDQPAEKKAAGKKQKLPKMPKQKKKHRRKKQFPTRVVLPAAEENAEERLDEGLVLGSEEAMEAQLLNELAEEPIAKAPETEEDLLTMLGRLQSEEATPAPQSEEELSYADFISPETEEIEFGEEGFSEEEIFREVSSHADAPVTEADTYTNVEYSENERSSNAELFARFDMTSVFEEEAPHEEKQSRQPARDAEE